MNSKSASTVPGQMAGYLFQPERALFHLATSPAGAIVGIETLDDVAVLLPSGNTIREQDKHSVIKNSVLHERQIGLWKTLNIWLSAVATEEIDISKTELHFVTNKTVSRGFLHQLLIRGRSIEDLKFFVGLLRKVARQAPKSIRRAALAVSSRTTEELTAVLEKTHVIDANQAASGAQLKERLKVSLPLPLGHEIEILQFLLGWIHDTILEMIREGLPAWIDREAFVERYLTLTSAFHNRRFLAETAEALIPVSEEKRAAHQQRLFVKQLLWLGFPEDDEQLIEAIDDFVRSSSERIRLAKTGVATLEDFRSFEQRLVGRWRNVFKSALANLNEPDGAEHLNCGKKILYETLNHRESLAKYDTQEWYLTRGAYHRLADRPLSKPRIGWHPLFEAMCKSAGNEFNR